MRQRKNTVAHGKCGIWFDPFSTLAEAMDSGAAILEIRPAGKGAADYLVQRIRSERKQVIAYRLEKMVGHPEEAATVYEIDASFGTLPAHWRCDCPDAKYRRDSGVICKHIHALQAALRRCGLLADPQPLTRVAIPAASVEFDNP